MANAPEFNPSISFTETGVNGADLDTVLAELKTTLLALRQNQDALQRDDQKLENGSVHALALSGEAMALINATFDFQGPFASAQAYTAGQSYSSGGRLYLALISHTSSSVSADVVLGNVVAVTTSDDAVPNIGIVNANLSGTGNVYIFTAGLTAYTDGENYNLVPNHTNTGAVTINRDSQGAKALLINGRAAQPGEVVSGRKIQVGFSSSLDSWELLSGQKEKNSVSGASGLSVLVTGNTAFNVNLREAVLSDASGNLVKLGSSTKSIASASTIMNGSYSYSNDAWYGIYILSDGQGSFEVELVPDQSSLVVNSSHPFSARIGSIRNSGGNLVRTQQVDNHIRFLQDQSVRASAILDSASGLESVNLLMPVDSSQAEIAIHGTISGATTTVLEVAQGSELQTSQAFRLTAGCTDQSVIRNIYARNDSNVRKIDIQYTAGSANVVSVFICGFTWR